MGYPAFGDYWVWANQSKVTFDGDNRLVIVNPDVTSIDIQEDVYSNWKEWVQVYDNTKYEQAMRSVGGDPTVGVQQLGSTYFLINGWKMRTWEGDHRLTVVGNVYTEDGSSQFVPTLGDWNITVQLQVSNIIDTVATGGGGNTWPASDVWSELTSGNALPGTKGKELADALKILKLLLAG